MVKVIPFLANIRLGYKGRQKVKHSSLLRYGNNYSCKRVCNTGPRCELLKHVTCITYGCSKVSWCVLITLPGSMHSINGVAYFLLP